MDDAHSRANASKMKYYLSHKDDPNFQARQKEIKRAYYQRNKERLAHKAWAYYYTSRGLTVPLE